MIFRSANVWMAVFLALATAVRAAGEDVAAVVPHQVVFRRFTIVSTDATQDGDLLCVELLPVTSWRFQLAITIIWATIAGCLLLYTHRVKKRTGDEAVHLQHQQPLFVIYPLLKFGSHISILIMMELCYSDPKTNNVGTLVRYLLMI